MPGPSGDTLSLDQFAARFERVAPRLWCVAAGVLGSREGAEDAVQDAALQAMSRLESFRAGTDFTAWMAQIVRYAALNQRRRIRRAPQHLDPELHDPGAPAVNEPLVSEAGELLPDQTVLDDHVLGGLNGLHELQRTCLLLRTVLELPYREIGQMLDIPEGTAMSNVHRARQQLVDRWKGTPAGVTDTRKVQ